MNDPIPRPPAGQEPEPWPWPDALDAMTAAPEHHSILLENERVRVLDTHIPPGDITAVHTHRWQSVYTILSWSDFVRRDDTGQVMLDTREGGPSLTPPATIWSEPLPPHTLENVGESDIHLISVELKGG